MMLLDYFGVLVGFLEKWTKSANLSNFGVLRRSVAEGEALTSLKYAKA